MWLKSGKVQFLVNGEIGKEIVCKKRLRQQNPLSPLLNVHEGGKSESDSEPRGYRSSTFTNLKYVDNTLNFL